MNIFAFVIGLVVVVLTMVFAFLLVIINESKKPRNKVRFYIAKPSGYFKYFLYLGKPRRVFSNGKFIFESARNGRFITDNITDYNLNPRDFCYMEIGEIKEVYINMED